MQTMTDFVIHPTKEKPTLLVCCSQTWPIFIKQYPPPTFNPPHPALTRQIKASQMNLHLLARGHARPSISVSLFMSMPVSKGTKKKHSVSFSPIVCCHGWQVVITFNNLVLWQKSLCASQLCHICKCIQPEPAAASSEQLESGCC